LERLTQPTKASNPSRRRALALALGTLIGALAALAIWSAWKAHHDRVVGEIQVVGSRADVDALLRERARDFAGRPAPKRAEDGEPRLLREPIDESIAVRLFPQIEVSHVAVMYDPHCYFRFRGNLKRKIPFAERPEGEWLFQTNSQGLREDTEIAAVKPELRVIVTGDSHTEGLCNNRESYPNVLETALGLRHPGHSVEVLNCAKSGYSFYNYLGMLERFLDLKPDVFVMGVYGGNDFIECTTLHHYFQRTDRPSCSVCDYDKLVQRYPDVTPNIFQQAYMQLVYFRHHPDERAVALEAACQVTAEVQRVCREHKIRLIVAYIPPFVDVQPKFLGHLLPESIELFAMKPDDLQITNRIVDDWLAYARGRGIECLDLRARIASEPLQLYWDRDHHLNLVGNRVVAESLLPTIEPELH
jgi:hypothetical protein